jgi:DNA-binding response OmpR family regulator
MERKVRILVLDGSQLMGWLVDSLAPGSVAVHRAASFDEARWALEKDPPDVAIFNMAPANLPWHELRDLCRVSEPEIPFLCVSTVEETSADLEGCQDDRAVVIPIPNSELQDRIGRLINEACDSNSDRDVDSVVRARIRRSSTESRD